MLLRLRFFLVFIFILLCACVAPASEIKGKVTNAISGESLGRVAVLVVENKTGTVTSAV